MFLANNVPKCQMSSGYFIFVYCRAFDVDMLHIAQYYKMPIGEVAVNWTEIDGKYLVFHGQIVQNLQLITYHVDLK